jgi:hypothetical protein
MLFRTLGTLDLVTVLILMGAAILPHKLLLYAALYLIIKGALFIWISKDFASYGDFGAGLYLLILSFGFQVPYVHTVVLFYLLQKTILTFIAIGLKMFLFYQENKDEFPLFR